MKQVLLIITILILITLLHKSKENLQCSNYTNAIDCEKNIIGNVIKQCTWDGEDNVCRNYTIN